MNNEDYKIAYENVMIANKMLEQENKQLKQRNKEIYDGFMVTIDEVCETDREKREYKSRIDKAIEYIENLPVMFYPDDFYEENHKEIEWNRKELLEILGEKEND